MGIGTDVRIWYDFESAGTGLTKLDVVQPMRAADPRVQPPFVGRNKAAAASTSEEEDLMVVSWAADP